MQGGDLVTIAAFASQVEGVAAILDRLPCRLADPELFFAESPADVEAAKALCIDCPIRMECLAGALDRREPWGVWGGELFIQGVVVARKRPRGRPRKHPMAEPVMPAAARRMDEAAA
jgi:WhiB family transcriptional regulator, redox-sensing transcriptional regulator